MVRERYINTRILILHLLENAGKVREKYGGWRLPPPLRPRLSAPRTLIKLF